MNFLKNVEFSPITSRKKLFFFAISSACIVYDTVRINEFFALLSDEDSEEEGGGGAVREKKNHKSNETQTKKKISKRKEKSFFCAPLLYKYFDVDYDLSCCTVL